MASARESSISFGEIRNFVARESTNGVPMTARVSFIRTAEKIPMPKRMKKMTWSVVRARDRKRDESMDR